jgi:DtxR family Mn-dependent transcriptional regulator
MRSIVEKHEADLRALGPSDGAAGKEVAPRAAQEIPMPTVSVENYLKAIYALEAADERVKTKELAEHLEISRPSVTSMLQTLAGDELVDYRKYRGVRLTDAGREIALSVIRNHRLIEVFLVRTLGFTWDEVHDEAERLEHAVSDRLIDRIDRFLSYPRFDPHGDPIPTADGEVIFPETTPLSNVPPGRHVQIERVLDQTPEVLRHLDKIGLRPQRDIEVLEVLSIDGQMSLSVADETISLSHALASRVLVSEYTPSTSSADEVDGPDLDAGSTAV